jgi:hypothetical protein
LQELVLPMINFENYSRLLTNRIMLKGALQSIVKSAFLKIYDIHMYSSLLLQPIAMIGTNYGRGFPLLIVRSFSAQYDVCLILTTDYSAYLIKTRGLVGVTEILRTWSYIWQVKGRVCPI